MTNKQWKTNPTASDYASIVTLRQTTVNHEYDDMQSQASVKVYEQKATICMFGNVWSAQTNMETVYKIEEYNLVKSHYETIVVVWDNAEIVFNGINYGSVVNGTIHIVCDAIEPDAFALPNHFIVYNGNHRGDGVEYQWYDYQIEPQTQTPTVEVCVDCITVAEMWEHTDDDHITRYNEARKHGMIDIYTNEQGEMSITAFSKSPCEYCGSTLAGERYTAYYHSI